MKRLVILAAVFVALAGLLGLQRWQRSKIVVAGPLQTVKIDPEKVTKLQVHKRDGDVELERVGTSAWKITKPVEYPASNDLVQGMLKAVEELKLEDVISSSPGTRGTYQVDSTGTGVVIWTGDKKALDVVVGKTTSDFTHTFVRPSDRNEVYRADGVLSYSFNRRADEWRDKTILGFAEKDLSRVVLEYPKKSLSLTLVRADSTHWNVQEGASTARADSATAARLVSNLSRLMTADLSATPSGSRQVKDVHAGVAEFQVQTDGWPGRRNRVAVRDHRRETCPARGGLRRQADRLFGALQEQPRQHHDRGGRSSAVRQGPRGQAVRRRPGQAGGRAPKPRRENLTHCIPRGRSPCRSGSGCRSQTGFRD
jgi:hypothetical protein